MLRQGQSSGFFQPVKLDVDEKILDHNLKIVSDEDAMSALFPGTGRADRMSRDKVALLPEPDYPSVQVRP
jgi:hypothetical protein